MKLVCDNFSLYFFFSLICCGIMLFFLHWLYVNLEVSIYDISLVVPSILTIPFWLLVYLLCPKFFSISTSLPLCISFLRNNVFLFFLIISCLSFLICVHIFFSFQKYISASYYIISRLFLLNCINIFHFILPKKICMFLIT